MVFDYLCDRKEDYILKQCTLYVKPIGTLVFYTREGISWTLECMSLPQLSFFVQI